MGSQSVNAFLLLALAAVMGASTLACLPVLVLSALTGSRRGAGKRLAYAGAIFGCGLWATQLIALLGHGALQASGVIGLSAIAGMILAVWGCIIAFCLLKNATHSGAAIRAGALCGLAASFQPISALVALDNGLVASAMLALPLMAMSMALTALGFYLLFRWRGLKGGLAAAGLIAVPLIVYQLFIAGFAELGTIDHRALEIGGFVGTSTLLLIGWAASVGLERKRRRIAADRSAKELSRLVRGLKDTAVYLLEPDGTVASWSEGARRIKGYEADEIIGQSFAVFYSPEDRAAGAPEESLRYARENGIFRARARRYRKDGSWFWASISIEPSYDEFGNHTGFLKLARDVTRVVESERALEAATTNMLQGLILFGADGQVKLFNARIGEFFGKTAGSLAIGMTEQEALSTIVRGWMPGHDPADRENRVATLMRQLRAQKPTDGATVAQLDDDMCIAISRRAMPEGEVVMTIEDITERQKATQRLEYMATHDALTGLLNRESFHRLMEAELSMRARADTEIAVAIIDLDHFKEVNDICGHATGDALLRQFAMRLSRAVSDIGIAARLGGDEFAVFAKISREPGAHGELAARLEKAVQFHATYGGHHVQCSASIGIAPAPPEGASWPKLASHADLAMYRAKATATGVACFYESAMDDKAQERRELQAALRDAVGRNEFHLVYQPQVNIGTGALVGYEALLRWRHESLGDVPPERFIKPAEENGTILGIGEWVLRTACEEAAGWSEPNRVAVNISPLQLIQPDLHLLVADALAQSGLSPERLEIEITESAIISDKIRALHNLRQVKALGVTVAIDDFGTGYSSLDTLNSFEFDKIKIDRTFLLDASRNEGARAIIRAILALGRSLGLPVLAEGVETDEDLALLLDEQCLEGQGYYFGRPAQMSERRLAS